ncbi:hypothetical protein BHC48_04700 [Snodgrassella communis]|uniref:Uncharacterized protein n=1 Tax=Snodgrassella alvi TaxID=1196083 RepID=A0A2N9XRH5_9NEIS|nr:hypothetical protein BHC48_04700 [Snodgrassella communis]
MNFIKLSVMVLNVWLMLKSIEDKLRQQAKHYNKTYLGEMLYVDSKRLPLLKNEKILENIYVSALMIYYVSSMRTFTRQIPI